MDQKKALSILKSGRNVFLTGSAGAGKTYVLNQYLDYLRERDVHVAITASTGIAATHLNGMTIHSWSGIGVKSIITENDIKNLKDKKYITKNFKNVQVLVIDEISMLHKNQVDSVNEILKAFKDPYSAFGGIQVIFSGDFFQLPPVGERGELNKDKFAFMSQAWVEAQPTICYLTEQYRQNDQALNNILNEIREGQVSQESGELLLTRNNPNTSNEITKLYTHNVDVDNENYACLDEIPVSQKAFEAKTKGNAKLLETLKKSVLAEYVLYLKVGAKVMFVKNNFEKGYANGTIGEVIDFNEEGFPMVKIKSGTIIIAEPEKWSVNDDSNKELASLEQIPLRLAWAITIHKSQGVTLDEASIDLSKTFEKGQGYVALSRLRNLEGLYLKGLNQTALQIDGLALKADKRFKELSQQAELLLTDKELIDEADTFLKKIGGLTDPKEIQKLKAKTKDKSIAKKSTYDRTKELIEAGKTIDEIAEERGLGEGTIVEHLLAISKKYPDTDIARFKPANATLKQVEKAYNNVKKTTESDLNEGGFVSLKAVYELLDKKISYEDIKLCLPYIE